jgi:hypothetical protein
VTTPAVQLADNVSDVRTLLDFGADCLIDGVVQVSFAEILLRTGFQRFIRPAEIHPIAVFAFARHELIAIQRLAAVGAENKVFEQKRRLLKMGVLALRRFLCRRAFLHNLPCGIVKLLRQYWLVRPLHYDPIVGFCAAAVPALGKRTDVFALNHIAEIDGIFKDIDNRLDCPFVALKPLVFDDDES